MDTLNVLAMKHVGVVPSAGLPSTNAPTYKFVCRSPAPAPSSPLGSKRPALVAVVTPPTRAREDEAPPRFELDGSPKKRVRFYSSLSLVSEDEDQAAAAAAEEPAPKACARCGRAATPCRGVHFDRSDLDYFEPCARDVCLECDAPECGECGKPIKALPFCKACTEMVVYEGGSYVADVPQHAAYLCKGGGDDCCCNALVCDECHARSDREGVVEVVADARARADARGKGPEPFKYVLQEDITEHTRLCTNCVDRVSALFSD